MTHINSLAKTLLVLSFVAVTLGADNWVHLVYYSASGCPSDKWLAYSTIKIAGGCSQNGDKYIKYDCKTFKAQACTDNKCTAGCADLSIYDFSNAKDCVQNIAGSWSKAFCSDVSSPYPGAGQVQQRIYNTGAWLNCSSPMVYANGFPTNQCVNFAGSYSKYSCNGNSVTFSQACDANCNNCGSTTTQNTITCLAGNSIACGVGSASTIVVSVYAIILSVVMLIFL
eukprot:TRINITY_DN1692_c0_g1_i2.p1 TRINITY_DN1692_c0_g1~~TRINITY_DN1692_c0_g1_i2.p1  ORF type:complete len:226 (+),score=22.30 TRINITY_DN1692_c0_g1_i2:242-919(+)